MFKKIKVLISTIFIMASMHSYSADYQVEGLSISYIRVVGDYQNGDLYDNTIELHFSAIAWPTDSNCAGTRVYIDAANTHLVSAAYAAYIAGMTIDINADDTLPKRGSNCELSYMDINRT